LSNSCGTAKQPYCKPWLSVDDQLNKLTDRGLIVEDAADAKAFLRHVGYYRFAGYLLAFEVARHQYVEGTSFGQVKAAYEFDARLRDLFREAIELVEVDLGANVAYSFGKKYGAFGHLDKNNFHQQFGNFPNDPDKVDHAQWLERLQKEAKRSREIFAQHFRNKHTEFPDLPIWAATELMTFGQMSRMIRALKRVDRKQIAGLYGIPEPVLRSLVLHLTYVRNCCAHHLRLWDKKWAVQPELPKHPDWQPPKLPTRKRVFATVLLIKQLLDSSSAIESAVESWRDRVTALLRQPPNLKTANTKLGLPKDWESHPVWIQE
jgi:abortive infection bacteriophage resistance protein